MLYKPIALSRRVNIVARCDMKCHKLEYIMRVKYQALAHCGTTASLFVVLSNVDGGCGAAT